MQVRKFMDSEWDRIPQRTCKVFEERVSKQASWLMLDIFFFLKMETTDEGYKLEMSQTQLLNFVDITVYMTSVKHTSL